MKASITPLWIAAMAGGLLSSTAALAQSADPTVATLQAEVNTLQAQQQAQSQKIELLEKRILELQSSNEFGANSLLPDANSALMRGRGVGSAAAYGQNAAADQSDASRTRKTPAPTQAVEAVSRSEQGYFGQGLSIDPGVTYSNFSNAQLNLSGFLALDAIFLGLISVDQVNANVITTDVTVRYGLRRFQADVNIPYLFRMSNFRSGGAGGNASALAEQTVRDRGLGDINAGLSYRLFPETARGPDVVISARVKAPTGQDPFGVSLIEIPGTQGNLKVPSHLSTGSGVWGMSAGFSMLKTIDPMVVFGSLTYFRNFNKHFPDISEAQGNQPGEVSLGEALQYGAGLAFALNDSSSISASLTERFVRHSRLRLDPTSDSPGSHWQYVVGSEANVGVLNLGATFSLSPRATLLTNIGVGITKDAPDMVLSVRVPYQF